MAFSVVLDTCVLYPATLRDTLLRLAEAGSYRPLWSDDILTELRRNVAEIDGVTPAMGDHLVAEMATAFSDASVRGYEGLIDAMMCDAKDRHVLAAAVHGRADAIVTFNTKDFPQPSVEPYDIEVVKPDEFLLDLFELDPAAVLQTLEEQAVANKKVPKSVEEVLSYLERSGCKGFVAACRDAVVEPDD